MRNLLRLVAMLSLASLTVSVAGAISPEPTKFLWPIPTKTVAGQPFDLTNLGGYVFYCGASSGVYTIEKDLGLAQQGISLKTGQLENYVAIADMIPMDGTTYYCTVAGYTIYGKLGTKAPETSYPLVGPAVPGLWVE